MNKIRLYRAVSEAEFHGLMRSGKFQVGRNSLSGKWFAESADDAARWGDLLQGPKNYRIITIEIPSKDADRFFRIDALDKIGPARYAELAQLSQVTFQEVKHE